MTQNTSGRDMRKVIETLILKSPKQTMDVVVALYRENGPEKIDYKGYTFTNRDLLMDDEVYDKWK